MIKLLRDMLEKETAFRKMKGIKVKPLSDLKLILFHRGWFNKENKKPYMKLKRDLGPFKMALSFINSKDIKAINKDELLFGEEFNYSVIDLKFFF